MCRNVTSASFTSAKNSHGVRNVDHMRNIRNAICFWKMKLDMKLFLWLISFVVHRGQKLSRICREHFSIWSWLFKTNHLSPTNFLSTTLRFYCDVASEVYLLLLKIIFSHNRNIETLTDFTNSAAFNIGGLFGIWASRPPLALSGMMVNVSHPTRNIIILR